MTRLDRFSGWWVTAERAASALTRPRTDVARSDEQVLRLVRGAALVSVGRPLAAAMARAWPTSRTSRWLQPAAHILATSAPALRLKMGGVATMVAALVAAFLQMVGASPHRLLEFMLPAFAMLAGAIAFLAAAPLARAWEDKLS